MRDGLDSNANSLKRLKIDISKRYTHDALKKARRALVDQKEKTESALKLVHKTKEELDLL